MAEYSGQRQIAIDCRRLRQSYSRSLVAKSVEIGRRVLRDTSVTPYTRLPVSTDLATRDRL